MNTRLLFFILYSLFFSPVGAQNVIDEVVWVVGDEAILKSDIEQMRLQAAQEGLRFAKVQRTLRLAEEDVARTDKRAEEARAALAEAQAAEKKGWYTRLYAPSDAGAQKARSRSGVTTSDFVMPRGSCTP